MFLHPRLSVLCSWWNVMQSWWFSLTPYLHCTVKICLLDSACLPGHRLCDQLGQHKGERKHFDQFFRWRGTCLGRTWICYPTRGIYICLRATHCNNFSELFCLSKWRMLFVEMNSRFNQPYFIYLVGRKLFLCVNKSDSDSRPDTEQVSWGTIEHFHMFCPFSHKKRTLHVAL